MVNSVNLVGRVGSNPEVRYFESGTQKTTFSLAVNRPTSKDDTPDWFNIETWGKTADVCANYVRKGGQVGITGRLQIQSWTDKEGNPRSRPVVVCDRLDLLGKPNNND